MAAPVTIVVHLEGDREEASRCLGALAALHPEPAHETIVVDDAATGLDELLDDLPEGMRLVRKERREGLIACAVQAATQASGEIVLLVRGAAELAPAAIGPLVIALGNPRVAAAAASLPLQPDCHPSRTQALALRREDVARLGNAAGTAPGFELAAACVELAASGRRVRTEPASVAGPPRPRATTTRATLGEAAEVTIVIPTLDAASDRVRACVAAVQAKTDVPHQIVLVDNGAPPQGFTAPVNAGLRAVDTPYAVVMNDDVEPQSGWWPPLRQALDAGAAIAFPLTEGSWYRTDFSAWCFALSAATLEEMADAPGEFFDPQLRVWYQDTDLLTRLRAVDRPPQLVRDSRIRHALSTTVESEDPDLRAWVERMIEEDRAAFERKHPEADG